MKLFLLSQTERYGYATFDSLVVAAEDAAKARSIHPGASCTRKADWTDRAWCSSPDKVLVTHLGEAVPGTQEGIICESFNDG